MSQSQYVVGKQWWFPELGRKPDAGEVIKLPEDVAQRYMDNEPGLLKPARQTTQARATNVRSAPKKARGRSRA